MKLGTALSGTNLQVIGQVKPQRFFLVFGDNTPLISITPHVAPGLTHPLNGGAQFLRKFGISLDFGQKLMSSSKLKVSVPLSDNPMAHTDEWEYTGETLSGEDEEGVGMVLSTHDFDAQQKVARQADPS